MCVIIVKPAGTEMPTTTILTAAYQTNPDGCGFATPTKAYKSLSFRGFKTKLAKVTKDEPCIIHFRLATHGSVKKSNCHPFNLGNVYFAHNGILNITPIGDKTDSETAFIRYIYPAIERYGWNNAVTDAIISEVCGGASKFAIICNGDVRMYGNFTLRSDGCYYSNLRFLERHAFMMYNRQNRVIWGI